MMDISFQELVLLALASFRLTRLFVYDKITGFIRNLFIIEREELDENGEKAIYLIPRDGKFRGFFGELLSCYWCTGMWSSIVICVLYFVVPAFMVPIVIILAVAGLAAIVESILQIWI